MSSTRLAGAAGLLFVALVGSVNLILGSAGVPGAGASPEEVQAFFAEERGSVVLASAMATLVWLCLPLLATGLLTRLRREPDHRVESWPMLGLAGVVMQNAVFAGVVGTQAALVTGTVPDGAAWGLWQLHNALFTLNGSSLALVLVGFSVAGLRTGVVRRWHGRLGLVAAGVLAASSFTTPWHSGTPALSVIGLVGFVLWLVWVATYSLVLLRDGRPARVEPALGDLATA